MKRRKRDVGQAQKRIAELDRIFKRIYEDDISGAISHDRFLKLSAEYEAEQRVQKVDIIFNFVGEINFLSATKSDRQDA